MSEVGSNLPDHSDIAIDDMAIDNDVADFENMTAESTNVVADSATNMIISQMTHESMVAELHPLSPELQAITAIANSIIEILPDLDLEGIQSRYLDLIPRFSNSLENGDRVSTESIFNNLYTTILSEIGRRFPDIQTLVFRTVVEKSAGKFKCEKACEDLAALSKQSQRAHGFSHTHTLALAEQVSSDFICIGRKLKAYNYINQALHNVVATDTNGEIITMLKNKGINLLEELYPDLHTPSPKRALPPTEVTVDGVICTNKRQKIQ